MEHCWKNTDKRIPKYLKKTVDWPGIETGPPRWEVGNNRLCPCTAENLFHTSRGTCCFCRI